MLLASVTKPSILLTQLLMPHKLMETVTYADLVTLNFIIYQYFAMGVCFFIRLEFHQVFIECPTLILIELDKQLKFKILIDFLLRSRLLLLLVNDFFVTVLDLLKVFIVKVGLR